VANIGARVDAVAEWWPVARPSHVVLCQCDQLRILYHALRSRRAVPLVEGLSFITFPLDGLHKGRGDSGNHKGSEVGTTEVVGEDFDCLCFIHVATMAQILGFCKRCCASPPTGLFLFSLASNFAGFLHHTDL